LSIGVCEYCQLLEAGWRLSAGRVYTLSHMRQIGNCVQREVYSVNYMRQGGNCVQNGGVLCELHEADWRLCVKVGGGCILSFI